MKQRDEIRDKEGEESLLNSRRVAVILTTLLLLYYELYRWIPLGGWNWQFQFPVVNDQFYPDIAIGVLLIWFIWSLARGRIIGMWVASALLTLWVVVHCFDWWVPYARSLPENAGRYSYYRSHTQILPAIGQHYPPDAGHAILDFILFPAWLAVVLASVLSTPRRRGPKAIEISERTPLNARSQPVAQLPESSTALDKCSDQLKTVEMVLAETEAALQAAMEREKLAQSMALHDPLTRLANRELFDERLANAIAIADRRSWSLAIFFLDLDAFKAVNDAYGHAVGDIVLRETADRLIQCCREEDTVCRYGGDEFLALVLDPKSRANIEAILMRARDKIRDPFKVEDQGITLDISMGVAIYPTDGISGDELIRNADAAMYQAKANKSGWHFFGGDQGGQNG